MTYSTNEKARWGRYLVEVSLGSHRRSSAQDCYCIRSKHKQRLTSYRSEKRDGGERKHLNESSEHASTRFSGCSVISFIIILYRSPPLFFYSLLGKTVCNSKCTLQHTPPEPSSQRVVHRQESTSTHGLGLLSISLAHAQENRAVVHAGGLNAGGLNAVKPHSWQSGVPEG